MAMRLARTYDMKTKRIFDIIGLSLLALSQPTWAAGHGGRGGGGFGGGGGHFGGGGGHFGGGAAPHPGGRGFSGGPPAYFYSRGTHLATSPVRQSQAPVQQS